MTTRINLLLMIAFIFLTGTITSAFAQDCSINTVENVNVKLIDKAGRSPVYGMYKCEKALALFQNELTLRREAKDTFNEARVLLQIGEIYFEQAKWQESYDYYNQALPLYRQMKITDGESEALYQLAFASKYIKNYLQSVEYFEESFQMAQANDTRGWSGTILGYISDVYLESGDDLKAFEYFNKRLAYERKHNNLFGEYATFKAIGAAYKAKGKKADALKSHQTALDIHLKLNSGLQDEIVTTQTKELLEVIADLQK